MGNTHLNSLTERIKAKIEQDTLEIETMSRQQFENLSRSLSESSKNALSTTESIILKDILDLGTDYQLPLPNLELGLRQEMPASLPADHLHYYGSGVTGWGLIALTRSEVTNLRQEIAELTAHKAALEKTIAAWPLTLNNAPNGRFMQPTPPHTLKDQWTFNNQPVWKLE
jgi:hypothetical protein